MRSNRRRSSHGQAVAEFALILPLFMLLSLGVFDMGRLVSDSTITASSARAGLAVAVLSATSDVGSAIRTEAGTEFPNNSNTWGALATDTCTQTSSITCGDTGGCVASSNFWTTSPSALGCFAVGNCPYNGELIVCSSITWGTRPGAPIVNTPTVDNTVPVVVRVTFRIQPSTPMLSQWIPSSGVYNTQTVYGVPHYAAVHGTVLANLGWSNATPTNMATGSDGQIWFLAPGTTPPGIISYNPMRGFLGANFWPLAAASQPWDITPGPDGNMWFTENANNAVGKVTTTGSTTVYTTIGPAGATPHGICLGPDGNLWVTDNNATTGRIFKIRPSDGTVLGTYATTTAAAQPYTIAPGPDGYLWFTEYGAAQIGKIKTDGTGMVEYSAGISAASQPWGIVAGPDGNMWFTEYAGNRIARITTSGTVTQYTAAAGTGPMRIIVGPDQRLWYTRNTTGKIIRATTFGDPVGAAYSGLGAYGLTVGQDGDVWFVENTGPNYWIGKIY